MSVVILLHLSVEVKLQKLTSHYTFERLNGNNCYDNVVNY